MKKRGMRRFVVRRVPVGLCDRLARSIDVERTHRHLHNDAETIRAILYDYFDAKTGRRLVP